MMLYTAGIGIKPIRRLKIVRGRGKKKGITQIDTEKGTRIKQIMGRINDLKDKSFKL